MISSPGTYSEKYIEGCVCFVPSVWWWRWTPSIPFGARIRMLRELTDPSDHFRRSNLRSRIYVPQAVLSLWLLLLRYIVFFTLFCVILFFFRIQGYESRVEFGDKLNWSVVENGDKRFFFQFFASWQLWRDKIERNGLVKGVKLQILFSADCLVKKIVSTGWKSARIYLLFYAFTWKEIVEFSIELFVFSLKCCWFMVQWKSKGTGMWSENIKKF